jgi:hypothetical protein
MRFSLFLLFVVFVSRIALIIIHHLLVAMAASSFFSFEGNNFIVEGRNKRCSNADYASLVSKVTNLKKEKPARFTRLFWFSPKALIKC